MGPPQANYTPFPTNRSKPRFEPNHLGSTSLKSDQYLPLCYPSTSSNNESILSPSLPAPLALSTSNTSHDQGFRLPYDEYILAAPDPLAYDYVAPSPVNHSFFDTTFNVDTTGFEWSSTNSFPCPPRPTGASNQDSALHVGPNGFEGIFSDSFDRNSESAGAGSESSSFHIDATGFDESSNCSILRPSSSSEAGNQNSHCSRSGTWSMTSNSPESDGLRNGLLSTSSIIYSSDNSEQIILFRMISRSQPQRLHSLCPFKRLPHLLQPQIRRAINPPAPTLVSASAISIPLQLAATARNVQMKPNLWQQN